MVGFPRKAGENIVGKKIGRLYFLARCAMSSNEKLLLRFLLLWLKLLKKSANNCDCLKVSFLWHAFLKVEGQNEYPFFPTSSTNSWISLFFTEHTLDAISLSCFLLRASVGISSQRVLLKEILNAAITSTPFQNLFSGRSF